MPSAKNFLGLLEKLQSANITVHQNRCAVVRNRNATCMKCAEVCTSGCISYNDNELIISPEKCIGCGTCATVCPTCALEAHRPNDAELLHRCIQAMRAADGEVVIACEQIVNAAEGLLDLEKVVPVTCLGRVEESLLVTLAVAGAKHVSLIEGKCASCEHATGFHMAEQVRDTANTLLETWNSDTRVDLVSKFPHQVRLEGKSSFDAGKRRFFAEMGSEAKAAAGTTADYAVKETLGIKEKPESRFQKVMEDGTLPHFIPDRRELLLNSLSSLGEPQDVMIETRLWGPRYHRPGQMQQLPDVRDVLPDRSHQQVHRRGRDVRRGAFPRRLREMPLLHGHLPAAGAYAFRRGVRRRSALGRGGAL